MRCLPASLVLGSLLASAGCGTTNLASTSLSSPNLTGNWQIQSAVAPAGSVPGAGLLLLGSLTSQGKAVMGTFRLADLSFPNGCGTLLQQVVTVSGTVDETGILSLSSAAFSGSVVTIQLQIPPLATGFAAGTIAITGNSCTYPSSPAIGLEVPTLSGTFSGQVTASTLLGTPQIASGTASLTLTQLSTPGADGQFAVSGTLSFSGGGCNNFVAVTGTVSGTELMLSSSPAVPFGLSLDKVTAIVVPTGNQITAAEILYPQGPCGGGFLAFSSFSGTLTRP